MTSYAPKTDRKRGLIFSAIRELATRGRFTVTDLPFPRVQAQLHCRKLRIAGELKQTRSAGAGRYGRPAIYTRAKNLSPTTPRPWHT